MKRIAILAACLALAACGTTRIERPEPIIRTVEVKVPVDDPACAREAVARLGEAPAYPDTPEAIRAAPNLFERVKLLLAGRELRIAREAALADALTACATAPG
jgi:predicted small secreted protein